MYCELNISKQWKIRKDFLKVQAGGLPAMRLWS